MQNVLRQIKKVIYRLKRQYGVEVIIKTPTSRSTDYDTGVMTSTYTEYTIKRAVLLPTEILRKFVYDLSFIAANKNFTYGGMFDLSTKVMLIDEKDLADGYTPTIKDSAIIRNRKYNFSKIIPTEELYSYMIVMKEIGQSDDES
jgi:hypothetical protein